MSLDDLNATGLRASPSVVESERFGLKVTRVVVGAGSPEGRALVDAIDAIEGDVLIVRYDATRLDRAGTLTAGRRVVIPAGSLVYWQGTLPFASRVEPVGELELVWLDTLPDASRAEMARAVGEIARESFAGYQSHYGANPLLDQETAATGYVDWAMRSISQDPANALALVDRGIPVGMLTVEYDDEDRHVEVLLAGLLPRAQGKGWYRTLLEGAAGMAASRGIQRLVIPTQVYNTNVQRVWARVGMTPFAAVETLHLVEPRLLAERAAGINPG